MRKFILSIFTLMLSVIVLSGCNVAELSNDSSKYFVLSINPSIEIVVDENNVVEHVDSLNEDGDLLLVEIDVEGLPLEEALEAILDEALDLGFIDPEALETIIDVVIGADDEENFRERIKNAIDNGLVNRGVRGFVEMNRNVPELVQEAQELGVSVGKLRLIQRAQIINPELTLEEALEMEVNELARMIAGNPMKELAHTIRDEFLEQRNAILEQYKPQIDGLLEQIAAVKLDLDTNEDEEEIANLEAVLAELNADLEALRTEIQELVAEARQTANEQRQDAREEIRNANQARREENQARMEEHRRDMQERRNEIIDSIQEWLEERRPNQTPNPNRGR